MKVFLIMRGKSLAGGGGAERRFARLFRFFQSSRTPNLDVALVTNKALAESLFECGIVKPGTEGLVHPETDMGIPAFNRWLIDMVRCHQPDVVHLVLIQRSLIPFYTWLYADRSANVVSTLASATVALHGNKTLAGSIASRMVWRRSCIIDSLYPDTEMTCQLGRWIPKIRVSPCSFTDYSEYKPAPNKRNVVVFAGRLVECKNPMLLVKAVSILKETSGDSLSGWKVAMYGDGPLKKEVMSQVDLLGLTDIVSVGSAYSLSNVLSESRVFVSLQETDNYPSQSLLEAMACENVIIATDVGHTRLLVNENTGILIDPSLHALAEALRDVICDWNAYADYGVQAREHVMRHHSIDRFASYMINIWNEAASE